MALAIAQHSCVCEDAGFVYYVTVRVVDVSGQPVERAHVVIEEWGDDLWEYDYYGGDAGSVDTLTYMGFDITNADGVVISEVYTGLAGADVGRAGRARRPFRTIPNRCACSWSTPIAM